MKTKVCFGKRTNWLKWIELDSLIAHRKIATEAQSFVSVVVRMLYRWGKGVLRYHAQHKLDHVRVRNDESTFSFV